jgi:hypothetical protein
MVIQLSETLEIPRAARNVLLNAAGFTAAYRQRDLDDDEMTYVREAVDWNLMRHNPFPAMALDRHWRLVRMNRTAKALFGSAGVEEGDSLLEAMTDDEALRSKVENWGELVRHTVIRLRTESAHLGGDPVLDAAADKLAAELDPAAADGPSPQPAVILSRYVAGDVALSFFSTIAQFGSAEDIALADLKIELLFPADGETRDLLVATFGREADEPASD